MARDAASVEAVIRAFLACSRRATAVASAALLKVWDSSGLLFEDGMVVHIMLSGSYPTLVSATVAVAVPDRLFIPPVGAMAVRPSGGAGVVETYIARKIRQKGPPAEVRHPDEPDHIPVKVVRFPRRSEEVIRSSDRKST